MEQSACPHMSRAVQLAAKAGLGERSGGCFGAVVVKDGEVVGEGYNQVLSLKDPTCHAEVQAIRDASRRLGSHVLSGCVLYASGEPCPMCRCAAAWARIGRVVYASPMEDAELYGGFDDKRFYAGLADGSLPELHHDARAREPMLAVWQEYRAGAPQLY